MTTVMDSSEDFGFDWRIGGLCNSQDADLHYVDANDLVEERGITAAKARGIVKEAQAQAIAVCNACPIRSKCLSFAMANDEEWGVWGGMTRAMRLAYRPAWAKIRKMAGQTVTVTIEKNQDALHRNAGVNFRYQRRTDQARQTIQRLMEQPTGWLLDTALHGTDYGKHTRQQLVDMFDMQLRYPEKTAEELADGFGRKASWFNTLTRACRKELGT